jgi:cation diffusion facilitator CzcD-associated flavoprotein CzcO
VSKSFRDRLLVIGAGPVGLGMADALQRQGLPFDHVDASYGLGGNWRHGVFRTTHIVSSKRATAFADYPMPADYPDFPSAAQMLSYLEAYARDRGLDQRIELNKAVTRAWPLADESWRVVFADGEERTYKGLVVCNGHHWDRNWPRYPGTFTGEMIHSKDYKEPAQLANRRVLVIGGGNSGCDIACEASRVGASCDISLRSGYWFLPKMAFGRPLTDLPIWWPPEFVQRWLVRAIVRLTVGDYHRYGLPRPNHKLFERHPAFGGDLLNAIRLGRIKPRPAISRYEGARVHFADGSSGDYDLIVAATGFHNSFPFLPDGLVKVENEAAQVYGGAFPENVKNLAIVGATQPRNGFGALLTPAAALYARLIALQDELEHPIGHVLKSLFQPLPKTPLLNPTAARRKIWRAHYLVPIIRLQGRRLARKEPRERFLHEGVWAFESAPKPEVTWQVKPAVAPAASAPRSAAVRR